MQQGSSSLDSNKMKPKTKLFVGALTLFVLVLAFVVLMSPVHPAYSTTGSVPSFHILDRIYGDGYSPSTYDQILNVFIPNAISGDVIYVDDRGTANGQTNYQYTLANAPAGVTVLHSYKYFKLADFSSSSIGWNTLPPGMDIIIYGYECCAGYEPLWTQNQAQSMPIIDQAENYVHQYNQKTNGHAKLFLQLGYGELGASTNFLPWDFGLVAQHVDILSMQMQSFETDSNFGQRVAAVSLQIHNEAPSAPLNMQITEGDGRATPQQAADATVVMAQNAVGLSSIYVFYQEDPKYLPLLTEYFGYLSPRTGPSSIGGATLTLNPITSVPWSSNVIVTGKLTATSSGAGIGGKTITFTGTGTARLSQVTTNPDGTFSATGLSPGTVATGWQVNANFAGDSTYGSSFITSSYNTLKHNVSLTLIISPSSVLHGGIYSVSGTLKDVSTGKYLSSKTISFSTTSPITIPSTTTGSTGNYLVGGLTAPGTAGSYNIKSQFGGSNLYTTYSVTRIISVI
jgi:hypothetical protein